MRGFSDILGSRSLTLQKNAPNLLFFGGVAGMIGTTVLASVATLKVEEVLTEAQDLLKKTKEEKEKDDDAELKHYEETKAKGDTSSKYERKYTERDRQEDTVKIYMQASFKLTKLYAPAIVLGSASVAMLTKSHNMLAQRNAALTAAYVALDRGFREYRERVVEKYGEEEDFKFRYATEKVSVKGDDGKKVDVYRPTVEAASIYARFFDQVNPNWSKEPEYNLLFLHSQQRYANDLLNARGHVFLNEVYDMLGIERSQAGQAVGWIRSLDTDGYIDFGIFVSNADNRVRDFVNGREGSILLDFNVDGPIWNKIDTPREAPSWQRS